MNHIYYILFFLLFTTLSFGQENLVMNGGFEEYWQCPDDVTQIERCKYVYNPCSSVPSTSDYFNACYTTGSGAPVGIPNTSNGYQFTRSGNGMVGLGCIDAPNFQYREYIQLSLTNPMVCGQKYLIEGYFNLAEIYRYTIKNVGVLFSEEKIISTDFLYNSSTPQFTDNLTLINDTSGWVKLSFEYIPDKAYSFLTIGHFLKDSVESYVEVNPNALAQTYSCYFYLDDFSVTEIGDEEVELPNVITPNEDGINDYFELPPGQLTFLEEITIVNRWGEMMNSVQTPFHWDGTDFKGNRVTNGVYYYVTKAKESCKSSKERVGMIHVIY